MKDYYAVLEIAPTASPAEIKKQYRALVRTWHPDKFLAPEQKAAAQEKTKALTEAYRTLGNTVRRAQYDREQFGPPPVVVTQVVVPKPAPPASEPIEVTLQRREQKLAEVLERFAQERRARAAYVPQPPKELAEVEAQLKQVATEIAELERPKNTPPPPRRPFSLAIWGVQMVTMLVWYGIHAVLPAGFSLIWITVGAMAFFYLQYLQEKYAVEAKQALERAQEQALREKIAEQQALLAKKAALVRAAEKDNYIPGLGV